MTDNSFFDITATYVLDLEIDKEAQCSNNISVPTYMYKDILTNFQDVVGSYNLTLTDKTTGNQTYCCMENMHSGCKLKVPQNVYDNILCTTSISAELIRTPIPKGDLIKLQPCTKNFIDIKMLDKELEKILSKFSLLSANQKLTITYNGSNYSFIITDVYSSNNTPVSVIDVVNMNIKLDLVNPFLEEIMNDKKKELLKAQDCECDDAHPTVKFRLSKVIGGNNYDGKTSMRDLRKNAF